jgi:hypothetical protein
VSEFFVVDNTLRMVGLCLLLFCIPFFISSFLTKYFIERNKDELARSDKERKG